MTAIIYFADPIRAMRVGAVRGNFPYAVTFKPLEVV